MRDIAGLKIQRPKAPKMASKASHLAVRVPKKSPPSPKKTSKISKNVSAASNKKGSRTKQVDSPSVFAPIVPAMRPDNEEKKVTKFKTSSRDDLQIPAFGFIDVCFCLDTTSSMCGEIEQTKNVIQAIIQNIENKVRTEGLQMRFAIVSYRDHHPQDTTYVTQIQDFTDNFEAIKHVKTLSACGGGDFPEAVHDDLFDSATKLNWADVAGTPILRYIFHIADAPPHGK